jgi:addiction module HigA family antidote
MSTNKLLRGLKPMHPGELLREDVLPAMGLAKAEVARRLGVSRQTLYDIIDEKKPITPAMALRIGKFCGNGPELWLNLQKTFDLWQADRDIGAQVAKIHTYHAAGL